MRTLIIQAGIYLVWITIHVGVVMEEIKGSESGWNQTKEKISQGDVVGALWFEIMLFALLLLSTFRSIQFVLHDIRSKPVISSKKLTGQEMWIVGGCFLILSEIIVVLSSIHSGVGLVIVTTSYGLGVLLYGVMRSFGLPGILVATSKHRWKDIVGWMVTIIWGLIAVVNIFGIITLLTL